MKSLKVLTDLEEHIDQTVNLVDVETIAKGNEMCSQGHREKEDAPEFSDSCGIMYHQTCTYCTPWTYHDKFLFPILPLVFQCSIM